MPASGAFCAQDGPVAASTSSEASSQYRQWPAQALRQPFGLRGSLWGALTSVISARRTPRSHVPAEVRPLELHLWSLPGLLRDREVLDRLIAAVEHGVIPAARDGAELGIVLLHCKNVVAARHGDPVLGAFQLRLQREEILVGLEVGVVLGHDHQA